MTTDLNTDAFYDHQEYLDAVAAPEYRTSARYRDDVANKLARSHEAGTIAPSNSRRYESRPTQFTGVEGFSTTYTPSAIQPEPIRRTQDEAIAHAGSRQDPAQREAADLFSGAFSSGVAIALAASAPQFAADPSYRRAVADKVRRSAHSLSDADLQVARTLGVIA